MPNFFVWRTTLFAALGSALAGYLYSSTSGIVEMEGFQRTFSNIYNVTCDNSTLLNSSSSQLCSSIGGRRSNFITGFVVSSVNLGSAVGSLFAGRLSDYISRKYVAVICGLTYGLGSGIVASSYHLWLLLVGRVLDGMAIGMFYVVVPVYIGEMSPKESRGMLVSLLAIVSGFGLGIGLCTNIGFSKFLLGWRLTSAVLGLGGLVYALTILWIPHSPRWLVLKHRNKEAALVLSKINNKAEVDKSFELKDLKEMQKTCNKANIAEFFKWKYIRRFFLTAPLLGGTTTVGIFVVYLPVTFFCDIGIDRFTVSFILGPIFVIARIASFAVIDRIGRKILLISTTSLNVLLSVVVAALLQVFGSSNDIINFVVVAFVCLFTFSYCFGWSFVPWVIISEVFPTNVKGIGCGALCTIYWVFAFIYNLLTPFLLSPPFYIYGFLYMTAGANLLMCVYVILAIPETKGTSLENIDDLFSLSWRKRIGFGSLIRHGGHALRFLVEQNIEDDDHNQLCEQIDHVEDANIQLCEQIDHQL